jgi:phosphinothricin acetyltransferase
VSVLDGQTRPSFVRQALAEPALAALEVRMVLLDCGAKVRRARLAARGQPELARQGMDRWAVYLRGQADALGLPVIDTSKLTAEQVADRLAQEMETAFAPFPSVSPSPSSSSSPPASSLSVTLRRLLAADWPAVRDIYQEAIEVGDATFEREAPTWEAWDAAHLASCRLVAEEDGRVIGFAALGRVSARPVYAGVAEVSLYVAAAARARGIGRRLLRELVTASEEMGFWTLQAGIFRENAASLALHQSCGFRLVGTRERLGQMPIDRHWRDVLLLERRSRRVGQEPAEEPGPLP